MQPMQVVAFFPSMCVIERISDSTAFMLRIQSENSIGLLRRVSYLNSWASRENRQTFPAVVTPRKISQIASKSSSPSTRARLIRGCFCRLSFCSRQKYFARFLSFQDFPTGVGTCMSFLNSPIPSVLKDNEFKLIISPRNRFHVTRKVNWRRNRVFFSFVRCPYSFFLAYHARGCDTETAGKENCGLSAIWRVFFLDSQGENREESIHKIGKDAFL